MFVKIFFQLIAEIKDTWIENDFDIFLGGGRGWRGEMENCAYLRKNPGYAPEFKILFQ